MAKKLKGPMTPAEIVKTLFGVRPLARALNVSPSVVSRWEDIIPSSYHRDILAHAQAQEVSLTEKQLIWGI